MIAKNRVLSLWSQNKKLSLRQFGPATAVAVLLLYCGIDYCCTTAALYSSTAAVQYTTAVKYRYSMYYCTAVYILCIYYIIQVFYNSSAVCVYSVALCCTAQQSTVLPVQYHTCTVQQQHYSSMYMSHCGIVHRRKKPDPVHSTFYELSSTALYCCTYNTYIIRSTV